MAGKGNGEKAKINISIPYLEDRMTERSRLLQRKEWTLFPFQELARVVGESLRAGVPAVSAVVA